jgi:hypothetical protein
MKLKKFGEYSKYYQKDPKNFEKRLIFADPALHELAAFRVVNTIDEVLEVSDNTPVITWNNFNFSGKVEESFSSIVYGQNKIPTSHDLEDAFAEEPFIQKTISDRRGVKGLSFPIIAKNDQESEEFKTYGKFKKSEKEFDKFQEKPIVVSRFEVLVANGEPIHAQKKINKFPFDIDLARWKYLNEAANICKKIDNKWSPDYFIVSLTESNGKLYLESLNRSSRLTPTQGVALYESAYESHYNSQLPQWFKKKLFTDYSKPHYKKQYYDSLLLKPVGVLNYSKYLD